MALTLDLDPQPTVKWVSDRRICLNAKGVICPADDPDAQLLLVAEGGQIDLTEAIRHGLAKADGATITPPPEEKKPAVKQPPPRTTVKVLPPPAEKKSTE